MIHKANFVTRFNRTQHPNHKFSSSFPKQHNWPLLLAMHYAMSMCTPFIVKPSNGCSNRSASRHSRLPPRKRPRYPINRGIGQSQGRCGRDGEQKCLLLLRGIKTRFSTHTDRRLVIKPAHSHAAKTAATNQTTVPWTLPFTLVHSRRLLPWSHVVWRYASTNPGANLRYSLTRGLGGPQRWSECFGQGNICPRKDRAVFPGSSSP